MPKVYGFDDGYEVIGEMEAIASEGGPGSGNFGHAGRRGKRGGSISKGSGGTGGGGGGSSSSSKKTEKSKSTGGGITKTKDGYEFTAKSGEKYTRNTKKEAISERRRINNIDKGREKTKGDGKKYTYKELEQIGKGKKETATKETKPIKKASDSKSKKRDYKKEVDDSIEAYKNRPQTAKPDKHGNLPEGYVYLTSGKVVRSDSPKAIAERNSMYR